MAITVVGSQFWFKDAEGGDCCGRDVPPNRLEIEVPKLEYDVDYDGPPPQARQQPALILDRATAGELAAILKRFAEGG